MEVIMCYHQKYAFRKTTKDKMITIKNEAKTMTKHCNCKCKLNCTTGNYIKNGIIKHVNVNVKIIVSAKRLSLES